MSATISPNPPSAFAMSATVHGLAIGLALLFAYVTSQRVEERPKILELVAGDGDNFGAKDAAAFGSETGVGISLPQMPRAVRPEPRPVTPVSPVTPAPVTPAAVAPAPVPPAPAPKAKSTASAKKETPDLQKNLKDTIRTAKSNAARQIAREEKQRQAEEKKREAEQARQMSYEEFLKQKGAPSSKTASTKVPKVDGKGIAKGVLGGSTENTVGGAKGTALHSDNDDVLAAYYEYFKEEVRRNFEQQPRWSDALKAKIEVRSHADGSLTNARITKTSGDKDFDQAVLESIRRVKLPARPDKKTETIEFEFTRRAPGEG